MALTGSAIRYGTVAVWLHWLTAVLVIAAYVVSPEGREARIYAPAADFDRTLHETLGLLVLALTLLRLLWRAADRRPDTPPMARWMRIASKSAHHLLYVLLIAVPVVAVFGAWYQGHPVTVFLWGDIAPPMVAARGLGNGLAETHGNIANVILWLAGLHAAAALFHHYVLRDGVLTAMLPCLGKPADPQA